MLALLALLVLVVSVGAQFPVPWGGLLTLCGAALVGLLVWAAAFSWGFALLARFTYARGRDALANGLALALRSLPAFRDAEETESLCVNLRDPTGLHVDLWYTVYPDRDIIGFMLQTLALPLPGDYGQVPAKLWYLHKV